MNASKILLFLVLIAVLAFFLFTRLFTYASSEDAKKFFEEDLRYTYPNADVREIISIEKVSDQNQDYVLKAWVSTNLSTPCPEKIEVQYSYPSRNFIGSATKLVYGCVVCPTDKKNCHILYPEEAIIASHTYPQTEPVREFIKLFPKAKPQVKFLEELDGYKNVWRVDWIEENKTLSVYINQADNSIIKIES
ncbi:MAG: hypothetical protein ACK4J0_01555 [Candidatus Anstonellaceae archaeon]